MKSHIQSLEPDALIQIATMEDQMVALLAPQRFNALLMTLFAAIAAVLTAIGIYGIVAYSVSLRTWEIGLRMALGAHRRDVFRLVVRKGAMPVAVGLVVGILTSLATTRLLAGFVSEMVEWQATIAVIVVAVVIVLALFAIWWPARRASRLEPTLALRYE